MLFYFANFFKNYKNIFSCFISWLFLTGIFLSQSVAQTKPTIQESLASNTFKSSFTGILIYDIQNQDTVYQQNADRYFIPASTTKLFTFYAAHKILGDSLPGLKYIIKDDSLIFWGTGDPTFLHPVFKGNRQFTFLASWPGKLFYSDSHYRTKFFGPGWSWDDYNYYYSPERSPMPIYGNIVRYATRNNILQITPRFFQAISTPAPLTATSEDYVVRDFAKNLFTYYPKEQKPNLTEDVPFRQSASLQVQLLSDTLKKDVTFLNERFPMGAETIYSFPADSVYKMMLQASDNFLAEQILTMCAATLSDTLRTDAVIKYVTQKYLFDLPDKPVWIDGSGLSRKNLITPRSIVALLQKIYTEIPPERLLPLLSVGGKAGTLRSSYNAKKPFIFAKTGSLSNIYNLSGYLITKSGKTLLFTFMNNNFTSPTASIRREVEQILTNVYLHY